MGDLSDTPARSEAGQFLPGRSGNPAGRPRGARNRASVLADLLDDGQQAALVQAVVDRALAGDWPAQRACFTRLLAPARAAPVAIDLPPIASAEDVAEAGAALIAAVAAGTIAVGEAQKVMSLLAAQLKLCAGAQGRPAPQAAQSKGALSKPGQSLSRAPSRGACISPVPIAVEEPVPSAVEEPVLSKGEGPVLSEPAQSSPGVPLEETQAPCNYPSSPRKRGSSVGHTQEPVIAAGASLPGDSIDRVATPPGVAAKCRGPFAPGQLRGNDDEGMASLITPVRSFPRPCGPTTEIPVVASDSGANGRASWPFDAACGVALDRLRGPSGRRVEIGSSRTPWGNDARSSTTASTGPQRPVAATPNACISPVFRAAA